MTLSYKLIKTHGSRVLFQDFQDHKNRLNPLVDFQVVD